jgi:putative Holliday junction resolvase
MSTMGLDLGKRRIGVAIFDLPMLGVRPLTTVVRTSLSRDLDQLRSLAEDRQVRRIIIGLPLNMNGSEGPAAREARKFAGVVSEALDLPVELYDERLTSFEAESRLKGSSMGRNSRKLMVDQIAAALILESWLAAHEDDESVRG